MLNQKLKTLCTCMFISFISCIPFISVERETTGDDSGPTEPFVPSVTYKNDSYEPNNNFNSATLFSTDSIVNLICIPDEYDYFKVPVDSNTQTVLSLKTLSDYSPGVTANISLTMYTSGLSSIKTKSISFSSKQTDSVIYYSPVKDTFYLSVYRAYSVTSETKYVLTKKVTPIRISDISEPNNSIGTAALLTDSLISGFIATTSDTDCYKIPVTAGSNVVINMYFDSAYSLSLSSNCSSKTGSFSPVTPTGISPKPAYRYSCYLSSDDTIMLKVYNTYTYFSSSSKSKLLMPGRYTISILKVIIPNDKYEPNQTPPEARTIKAGKIDSLYIIGHEYDYYRLTFDTVTYVEAVLKMSKPSLSFALESKRIYQLLTSLSTSDSLKLSHIVNAGDTVYLRVNNPDASSDTVSFPYQLDIRTTPALKFDSIEPNDTKATARLLQKSFKSVLIGLNDTDYYKIPVQKGIEMQIQVSSDTLDTNYWASNLTVGNPMNLNENSSLFALHYNYYAITDDTVVLKVYRPRFAPSILLTNYSITLTPAAIRDDRFEQNDNNRGGTKLSAGTYDSLILLANDTDTYFFTSDTAVIVDASLTSAFPVTSECYLTFKSQSAFDKAASQSQTQLTTMNLRCFVTPGDTIFFQVTGYNKLSYRSFASGYSLSIKPQSIRAIDTLEPNNTLAKATSLINRTFVSSQLYSSSDTDYFSIPLYHEYFYRISATGDTDKSIPVTFVISDYQNKSSSTVTLSRTLGFDLRSNDTDSVYIKVYRQSTNYINTSCTYSLSIQTIKVVDDTFETNDTKTHAYAVTSQKYDSLVAFLGNPDYYKIDIDSGTTLFVTTNFTASIPLYGVFALHFESADATITSTSTTAGSTLSHSYTFNKKETVYLKAIYTNNNSTNTYSVKYAMDVRVIPAK